MARNHASPPPPSATQSSDLGASGNDPSLEGTRLRAQLFRTLLEEVENGRLDATSLSLRLQEARASPDEAKDYLKLLKGNLRHQRADQSADAIVWAQLRQKLGEISRDAGEGSARQSIGLGDLGTILDLTKPRSVAIPADVLAEAPHLQEYLKITQAESYLNRTWKLRQSYATEKATDAIVDLMQRQPMPDPLPRSIWRDIILDKYVEFEKLYAGMDEPKIFGGGYAIVERDHFRARKPVQTESEWARVARSWKQGVELLYPHRKAELGTYMEIIEELFRAAPHKPSIAICVDAEARDRYAKHPFRMDDRNQLYSSILAHMFRDPPTTSTISGKRRSSPPPATNKKARTVCRNWNLGFCNDNECPFQRSHVCHECGEDHRAKEQEACLGNFKKRRRPTRQSERRSVK